MALITFTSSTFSGLESSGVISASVRMSGGIVSSKDINVRITFTEGNASGYLSEGTYVVTCQSVLSVGLHFPHYSKYSVVPPSINPRLTYLAWISVLSAVANRHECARDTQIAITNISHKYIIRICIQQWRL